MKITDFGLARAANNATITRDGEVAGTPQYMSPEQALCQTVDSRSDFADPAAIEVTCESTSFNSSPGFCIRVMEHGHA